jgi:hypothetical protein
MKIEWNVELKNGKVVKQVKIPNDCEDVQEFLERKFKKPVITYDITNSDDLDADELKKEKDKALKIASDFCYPKAVADAILNAVTLTQISNVLAGARHTC